MISKTNNLRIIEKRALVPPAVLIEEIPITESASNLVSNTRKTISNILKGEDNRVMVITGPCSVHDIQAVMEYGTRLKEQIDKYSNELLIVMRVYFEKPRTTVGWKGLINDPDLDGSFQINKGLRMARTLLLDLANMGVPCGTEFLDVVSPQYVADLISWGAIGARTTESQIHRELASGLSCPVGFKNGTDGNIQIAIDAIRASHSRHHFLSITKYGNTAIFTTAGNPDTHVILRGGSHGPNYYQKDVDAISEKLAKNGLRKGVMIDCSHGNSNKDYKRQGIVLEEIARQIEGGSYNVIGLMLESHLKEGNQSIDAKDRVYGKSITDACISWEDTVPLLERLSEAVKKRASAK
jgi:3-deoxy-7-phosphoheptulonate synthase